MPDKKKNGWRRAQGVLDWASKYSFAFTASFLVVLAVVVMACIGVMQLLRAWATGGP